MVILWDWYFLFEQANSHSADLILSYWNTNEKSGPGFSVVSVFKLKVIPKARIAKIVHIQLLVKQDW